VGVIGGISQEFFFVHRAYCHIVAWNGGILPYQIMILVNCFDKSYWCMFVGTLIPSCFYPGPWLLLSHFFPIPCPTFIYYKVEEYCLKFAPSVFIYKVLHFSLNNILLSLYIYFLLGCWLEKPHLTPPLYFLRPQYLSFFFYPSPINFLDRIANWKKSNILSGEKMKPHLKPLCNSHWQENVCLQDIEQTLNMHNRDRLYINARLMLWRLHCWFVMFEQIFLCIEGDVLEKIPGLFRVVEGRTLFLVIRDNCLRGLKSWKHHGG